MYRTLGGPLLPPQEGLKVRNTDDEVKSHPHSDTLTTASGVIMGDVSTKHRAITPGEVAGLQRRQVRSSAG